MLTDYCLHIGLLDKELKHEVVEHIRSLGKSVTCETLILAPGRTLTTCATVLIVRIKSRLVS